MSPIFFCLSCFLLQENNAFYFGALTCLFFVVAVFFATFSEYDSICLLTKWEANTLLSPVVRVLHIWFKILIFMLILDA